MRRVGLKSPVRENCTPGSVRGALGNQRPYLDNLPAIVAAATEGPVAVQAWTMTVRSGHRPVTSRVSWASKGQPLT